MKYRGIECAVIQDVDRGTWSWTVNLINETESGLRKSREGALTAVVLTIDRWIARRNWNPVPMARAAQRAAQGR
jgi:hypothetical protein